MYNTSITFFLTTESEYPKLQKLCPDQYPPQFTYDMWKAKVDAGKVDFPSAVIVMVDVDAFEIWCKKEKLNPDTSRARMQYAIITRIEMGI